MATPRQTRKEKMALHEDPINFTCGKCRLAQTFQKDYKCIRCDVDEDENLEEVN